MKKKAFFTVSENKKIKFFPNYINNNMAYSLIFDFSKDKNPTVLIASIK